MCRLSLADDEFMRYGLSELMNIKTPSGRRRYALAIARCFRKLMMYGH